MAEAARALRVSGSMTDHDRARSCPFPPIRALRRAPRRAGVLVAFVALAVAVLAVAGRFAAEGGSGVDHIAPLVVNGTIATDPARLAEPSRAWPMTTTSRR